VPFLLGLAVGLAGLVIRRALPESARPNPEAGRPPVVEAFTTAWRSILQVVGVNLLGGVAFYLIFVYLVSFFESAVHLSSSVALLINTCNMVVLLVMVPVAGALSDRLGRKPLLLAGGVLVLVLAWPLFWLLHHPEPWLALAGQFGFAVSAGLYLGVVPVVMAEAFSPRVRCSAVSVGYNIALGLFGGTAPMVATALILRTHDDLSPAFYLMAVAAVSLVAVCSLPETSRVPLR
jgi:MHS family proline/betaine transporter-like MFS transporter